MKYPELELMEGHGFDHHIVDAKTNDMVAFVLNWSGRPDNLALAQLFVAAPKLLAACRLALQSCTYDLRIALELRDAISWAERGCNAHHHPDE